MKNLYISLLITLFAFQYSAANQDVDKLLNGRRVYYPPIEVPSVEQSRADDNAKFTFILNYNTKTCAPYKLDAVSGNDVYSLDYSTAMRGKATMTLPKGKYQFMAHFFDNEENNFIHVVQEDVEVYENLSLVFDATSGINRLHMQMLLPDGNEVTYNNVDTGEKGSVEYAINTTYIAYEGTGFIFVEAGVCSSIDSTMKMYGDTDHDILISNASDKWHFVTQRIAYTSAEPIDNDQDSYSAFYVVKGASKDVVVSNDISTYSPKGYLTPMVTSPKALYETEDAQYAISFSALEGDDPFTFFHRFYPWIGIPTARINYSFTADYTSDNLYKPITSILIQEGSEEFTGNASYVATPDGIEYPFTSYVGDPSFYEWQNLDSDGNTIYSAYPGHPLLSLDATKVNYTIGNSAPIYSIRIANTPSQESFNRALHLDFQCLGRLNETRDLDKTYSTMTITQDGKALTYKNLAMGWESDLTSRGQLIGKYDIHVSNKNAAVEGNLATSDANIHWSYSGDDATPPMLQALQMRAADGTLTDYLTGAEGDKILFAAADYQYRKAGPINANFSYMIYYDNETRPMNATLEYSKKGENSWKALEVVNHPEYDNTAGFGTVYSAELGGLQGEDQWFDIKLRLTDKNGNYFEQILSPAFKINNSGYQGISDTAAGIATPIEWYTIDGRRSSSNPGHGIFIVKYSDGSTRKVIQH